MVGHGAAKPGQVLHIVQGVEVHRPSHIYAHAGKDGEKVNNVRVGGNAVQIMEGTYRL